MKTKICSKCGDEKKLNEFPTRKNSKDGHRNECILCKKNIDKNYYNKNYEKILKQAREYRKENHEKIITCQRNYYEKNREEINKKDKIRSRIYRKENKNKVNTNNRKSRKEKYHTDPINKLSRCVRHRIYMFLKSKNIRKINKTFEIIGCNPTELKEHIEKQFTEGMSWKNYGYYGWHIDHRIPLDSGKTKEEIYKLSHFTNLQPMWWEDNLKKGKKIIYLYSEHYPDDDHHICQN